MKMKKRQIKKNIKKHVSLYGDEGNLLLYTKEEYEEAMKDRKKATLRIAKLGYKRIKGMKPLYYFYPAPKSTTEFLNEMFKRTRKQPISYHTVVQTQADFKPKEN